MLHPCAVGVLRVLRVLRILSEKTPRRTKARSPTHLIDMLHHPRHGHGLTSKMVSIHLHATFGDIFSDHSFQRSTHINLSARFPPFPRYVTTNPARPRVKLGVGQVTLNRGSQIGPIYRW